MSVPLMFPAEIDRFRLIQLIAWWARKKSGYEQRALAKKADVHQSSISHLENFQEAAMQPKPSHNPDDLKIPDEVSKKRISRKTFIKIFSWGVKFARADIDAMLWLYGEEGLNADEIERYLQTYDLNAKPQSYTEKDYDMLRGRVLDVLFKVRDSLRESTSNDGDFHHANVKLLFERTDEDHEEDHIRGWKELLRVEKVPGQRMMLMKHPSFLTFPKDTIKSGQVDERPLSETARSTTHELAFQRVDTLLQHLKRYGERAIHRKASIERYLTNECASYRPFEERREQVKNWIKLLEEHQHYNVGLYDDNTPELEFTIKSTVEVVMRGTSHDDSYDNRKELPQKNVLVPRYIHWTDRLSVLSFYLMFETYWHAIAIEDRTKDRVIEQLQQWMR